LFIVSKYIVILFGIFLIAAGILMFIAPKKVQQIIGKAGSTNFINYAEITIRMIPAAALVIYSDLSRYPDLFKVFGWFMIITSFVLYLIPPKMHHAFSVKSSGKLKPLYLRIISPFSILIGIFLIYCVSI